MFRKRKAPLSREEQEYLMEHLSDLSDIEDPVDNSDNDPWYKSESSEYCSDTYSEPTSQRKKRKNSQVY